MARRAHSEIGYVLVVDDEASIRDTARRFLEGHGYRVKTAASVDEGLLAIGPDLRAAILDVIFPDGRSGLDVLAAIRLHPGGSSVPVLMFTGYGFNPDVRASIEAGNGEVLHKPATLRTLAAWVNSHVG